MKGINFLFLILLTACASEPYDGSKVLNESLRQCYVESDSYTGKNGVVQGVMTTELFVTKEGKVTSCKITQNDFKDPNLNACVCGIFKQSVINNDKGHTIVLIQPVTFSPVKQ